MARNVDPEYWELLSQVPSLRLVDPVALRAQLAAAAMGAPTAALDGADVVITDDEISLENGARAVPIRLYRSMHQQKPSPGLVYFHGGAFALGDLDAEQAKCIRYAAEAGCTVVSVDYRLAPEHPFPAGVEDCYAGLCWLAEHADELDVDGGRLAVGGSSAGGALAAATSLMSRDRGGPALVFQLLSYPVTDDRMRTPSMAEFHEMAGWNGAATADMWGHYLGQAREDVSPYAAPARAADLTNLPAAFVITAEFDPLRDEGIDYALALQRAGVRTELHHFSGAPHGFDVLCPDAPTSRRAAHEEVDALRRNLGT
jgi:acetyl esterase